MAGKATAKSPATAALAIGCAILCILFSFICIAPGGFVVTPLEIANGMPQGDLEISEALILLFFVLLRTTPGVLLAISVPARNERARKALIRTAFVLPIVICVLPIPILHESRLLFSGSVYYLVFAALALLLIWIAPQRKLGYPGLVKAMTVLLICALVIVPILYRSPFEGAGQGLNCSFLVSNVALWLGGMFAIRPMEEDEAKSTGASPSSPMPCDKETAPRSTSDDLNAFKELLNMGAITQEEYDAKKREILKLPPDL